MPIEDCFIRDKNAHAPLICLEKEKGEGVRVTGRSRRDSFPSPRLSNNPPCSQQVAGMSCSRSGGENKLGLVLLIWAE